MAVASMATVTRRLTANEAMDKRLSRTDDDAL